MTVKSVIDMILTIGKGFILAFLICVAIFIILELISVLLLPKPPVDRAPLPKTVRHPTLGYVLLPNQVTYTYSQLVETNSDGLRERELDREELRNSRLILCLGGSETFGKGVAFEKTFSKVLEAKLRQGGNSQRSTIVINAGVPDYNLDQSLQFLKERVRELAPAVVILSFYWDDLIPVMGIGRKPREYTKPEGPKNNPVSREWFLRRWARDHGLLEVIAPIYTRSRLLYSVKNKLKIWIGRQRGHTYIVWRDAILEGRKLPALERAWSDAGKLLSDFVELSKQEMFRPVLLILPIEHQLENSFPNVRYQDLVFEKARLLSLDTVDILPTFQRHYNGFTSLFIPYDGRPNGRAHAIIAEQLLQKLSKSKQGVSADSLV